MSCKRKINIAKSWTCCSSDLYQTTSGIMMRIAGRRRRGTWLARVGFLEKQNRERDKNIW
jgi:hypothetical protein